MVELVPEYGVYCIKRQREEAVLSSTPTWLIRNLLSIVFNQKPWLVTAVVAGVYM